MKPVDQQFVHKPEIGQHGDCQRAVIASLLELPIEEVPHFAQIAQGDSLVFYKTLQEYLRTKGYVMLTIKANKFHAFYGFEGDVYHEISGPSPRGNGVYHAVVGMNGKVVFDPHPSRDGLAGDTSDWDYSYIVKV